MNSSKDLHLLLLSMLPNVDLRVVHLVQNSCAVAYSWQPKKRPEIHWKSVFMNTYGPLPSSVQWIKHNLIAEFGRSQGWKCIVPVEDFAVKPVDLLERIATHTGNPRWRWDFIVDNLIYHLQSSHMLGGNPVRFQQQMPLQIRADNEWRAGALPRSQKTLVNVLTWPFRLAIRLLFTCAKRQNDREFDMHKSGMAPNSQRLTKSRVYRFSDC